MLNAEEGWLGDSNMERGNRSLSNFYPQEAGLSNHSREQGDKIHDSSYSSFSFAVEHRSFWNLEDKHV